MASNQRRAGVCSSPGCHQRTSLFLGTIQLTAAGTRGSALRPCRFARIEGRPEYRERGICTRTGQAHIDGMHPQARSTRNPTMVRPNQKEKR
jgi:hypothetical protein